ncbi:MAG: hypothetical protein AB1942_09510 [Pseudomonadota bacterium]
MKAWILALGLLAGLPQAALAASASDGVLGRFVGTWAVSGTTRGEPTATAAEVSARFGGAFVEMHVADPTGKNDYEARVFFGQAEDGAVVVHWLDATGGGTSRTLGAGRIVGDHVDMTFAYPQGEMRNRLDYDRAGDRWRMRIETGPKDKPSLFSDWVFVRQPAR